MNEKIKEIIENNLGSGFDYETKDFKKFLIEICELQKDECANQFNNIFISLGKNVAE